MLVKLQEILTLMVALGLAGPVAAKTSLTRLRRLYHLDASTGVTKDANDAVKKTGPTRRPTPTTSRKAPRPSSRPMSSRQSMASPLLNFNGDTSAVGIASQLVTATPATQQTVILVCTTIRSNNWGGGVWGRYDIVHSDKGIRRDTDATWCHADNNDFAFEGSMSINGDPGRTQAIGSWGVVVAIAPTAVTFGATALGDFFMYADGNHNYPRAWGGQIAEVAVFGGTLTTDQISAIVRALGTKYNIAIANASKPQ